MTDMEVRNDAEGLGAPFDLPGLAAGRLTVLVQRNPDGEFLDFIRVGQDLRFAHAYLAELTTGGPAPLRQLALRVQRDMYDDEDQAPSVTNPQIEELWEDEHRYLLRFARQANDPRVLQYFALPPGDDGRLAVFPPILYLSTAEVFFHPACPSCGGGLRVCRDLKLLASRSLAPFSTSSRRYLYCRSCAEKTPNAVVFYRKLASESEQAAGVRSEYELYEDLKGAAGGKNTVEVMPVGGAAPRAIPAAQFDPACIRAFSFYDCRIIPVGCQSITYRQFCDCLGGIEWQPFLDRHERDLGPPQVMPSVAALRSVLEDPGRFLFAGHPGGMHTVEIFRLKLAMMRQLAAALDQYHTGVGLPHLGLDPDHILIDVPRSAGSQGALWSFKVRLGTLAATHRMTCGEGGDALTVLARPAGTGEAFLPPFAVNMRLYQVNRCDLTPESVDEVTPGVFRLNLTLECRAADLTQFSPL